MKNDAEKEAGAVVLRSYANFFKTQYTDYAALSMQLKENKTYMPIQIAMSPNEVILINDLVSSDNTMMTKVLSVLSSLCIEVITLKREANERHFRFLSVYDVYSSDSDISYQMESICLLSTFIIRCDETLRNMCSQVFAIFAEEIVNLNGIQLHYIINHIGELFTILVLLETLISRSSLAINWNQFRKNLKGVSIPPENSDFTEERLSALNGAIENITTKIMKDDIIQNSLTNVLTLRNKLVDKNCAAVAAEFSNYIKNALITLDKLIQEKPNINNMYRCIKINALFVLYSHLFGCTDKKMFKALVDLDVKVHSVVVVGTTIWFPEQFLQKYASSFCDNHGKLSQTMLKARQSYITNRKLSLSRDIISIQALSTQWILKMEEIFSSNHYRLSASEISLHAKTLLEGLDIASGTYHVVITLMNLHLTLGVPLSKSLLMSIFEIIEMLKSIKDVIVRNGSQITSSINMTLQHLSFQAVSAIQGIKKTLMSDKKYANRLDELTCIVVAERALKGAPTLQRNIAANVALNFVPDSTYIEDTHVKLGMLLEKMYKLSEFTTSLQDLCNCSWILWHQTIISIYFEQNFSTQLYAMKLKYFLLVLEDCVLLLQKTDLLFGANKSKEFIAKAMLLLDENLNNTSQNIETNLRLHIHSHLQLDAVNPFTVDMTKKVILLLDNLRVYRIYISAIPTVEHYLSTMYYNLTTVVLSDWKTYGEMRQMAEFKFNLKTVKDDLPRQTLEQGLDVLEIMRNIHIFVSKYLYNLNNQIFIEKSSNNKHLNSINIQHVANSIRTHGIGIMNTTVNFTYQFLKKKFFTFSQFMYDEHIKSRLIKDLRNFKETADNNENMYQFKNADKFNKGIKTLGTANDGQSYLDLFRDLISQIGNAMGYVRMIRSGGRHCCSDATVFLPSLDITKDFKQITEENKLNNKSIDSAEILDHNINNLVTNFIQGTEYFKLLVDAFAPVFRNPKNVHLKNFFIIIPPLTLNFVEHMILSKDKMSKKNKEGAAFTDDGFAMGIAYILKLLDQDSEFDELHWFESVWKYIKEERQRLEEQKTKGSVQLQQALALTERKIKTLENEFKLLYYSLTSARIFFR